MKRIVCARRDLSSTASGGFTIMEIMIATAILTLGLVGILALFPVAIDSGRKVMERSTAVTIAKSVAEAIRSGLRNQKRYNYRGAVPFTYFIFQHDGVKSPLPRNSREEKPSGDYYILLPQFRTGQTFESSEGSNDVERDRNRRMAAVRAGKEFVYPEDDDPPNGNGDPNLADNDGIESPDRSQLLVRSVYRMGNNLPDEAASGDNVLEDQKREVLKQYFYAFSIRASMNDTNHSLNPKLFQPGNDLYHIRVMVYRMFSYNPEKVKQDGKGQDPIYELDFEVAR